MIEPQSRFLSAAGREMHFLDWSADKPETVVIWHGVTGSAWDHAALALRLAGRYRVICPDSIGCGLTQWLVDHEKEAGLDFYQAMTLDMIDQLGLDRIRWIGTSKGGGLGIQLAGGVLKGRISHLVLNDIGPALDAGFRDAIIRQMEKPPAFDTLSSFETVLRKVMGRTAGWVLDDTEWRRIAKAWARRRDDGRITFHYDPALANQFRHNLKDFDLWAYYDRIDASILLLHGAKSAVLDAEQAAMMTGRGPGARLVVLDDRGHAPTLSMADEQQPIMAFLEAPTSAGERPVRL